MIIKCTKSGSMGNSILIISGQTSVLIDSGVEADIIRKAFLKLSINPPSCLAQIPSHIHSDHIGYLYNIYTCFGVKAYLTDSMYIEYQKRYKMSDNSIMTYQAGDELIFNNIKVKTISNPNHDASGGNVVFAVSDEEYLVTIMTDLSDITPEMIEYLSISDAILIESNYDEGMLENSVYPPYLIERIKQRGHLSNTRSSEIIKGNINGKTKLIALIHQSENNNTPEIALNKHDMTYGKDKDIKIFSIGNGDESPLFIL